MDIVLLSWHDTEILKALQEVLINAHYPITITEESATDACLMLVSSNDKDNVLAFLNNNYKSLGLPTELLQQINTRHGA